MRGKVENQTQVDAIQENNTFFAGQLSLFKSNLSDCDGDVNEIVKDVPKGVNLTDISYAAEGITIKGGAPSQDLALTYALALRVGGRFAEVTLTNVNTLPDGTTGFTIVLQ